MLQIIAARYDVVKRCFVAGRTFMDADVLSRVPISRGSLWHGLAIVLEKHPFVPYPEMSATIIQDQASQDSNPCELQFLSLS